jgi:hypothetical protein
MTTPGPDAGTNAPFAVRMAWSVDGLVRSPSHMINVKVSNHYGTIENQPFETRDAFALNVWATVRGRVRQESFNVTRNAYADAVASRTFHTNGLYYGWWFVAYVAIWFGSATLAWVFIDQPAIVLSLAGIAILLISPPLVSRAVVRGLWWAGRGFVNEPRARWILAGILWAVSVAALVELQIIVK